MHRASMALHNQAVVRARKSRRPGAGHFFFIEFGLIKSSTRQLVMSQYIVAPTCTRNPYMFSTPLKRPNVVSLVVHGCGTYSGGYTIIFTNYFMNEFRRVKKEQKKNDGIKIDIRWASGHVDVKDSEKSNEDAKGAVRGTSSAKSSPLLPTQTSSHKRITRGTKPQGIHQRKRAATILDAFIKLPGDVTAHAPETVQHYLLSCLAYANVSHDIFNEYGAAALTL